MKTQTIRLIDVFLIGPYLVWVAKRERGVHRLLLATIGVATIAYNGANWLAENKKARTP